MQTSELAISFSGGKEEKKIVAEKCGWMDGAFYASACITASGAYLKTPIWEVHFAPLSGVKWRLWRVKVFRSSPSLETLNTCQSSPET